MDESRGQETLRLGSKDVGAKAGWLEPGALKMATPSLIATTFICPDSNLLELP